MTLLTLAAPLLWLLASAGTFFLVFRPQPRWPLAATPARALLTFLAVFLVGAALVAVTRPKDEPPPKPAPAAAQAVAPDPVLVRAHPERYLVLDRVKGDKGPSGAVLMTGAAINVSGLPIGEPRLVCRLSNRGAPAGTVSTVIHAAVPAGGRLIFAAANLGPAPGAWDGWACQVAEARAG